MHKSTNVNNLECENILPRFIQFERTLMRVHQKCNVVMWLCGLLHCSRIGHKTCVTHNCSKVEILTKIYNNGLNESSAAHISTARWQQSSNTCTGISPLYQILLIHVLKQRRLFTWLPVM